MKDIIVAGDQIFKVCSKCKKTKSLTNFHKDNTHLDGYKTSCKMCNILYHQNYRGKRIEINRIYQVNYRKKYPDKVNDCKQIYDKIRLKYDPVY